MSLRFFSSLRFKMMAGVLLVLVISLSVVFAFQYLQLRQELVNRLGLSSAPLSDVIKGSLKHAMVSRNPEEIQQIVNNVSNQQSVKKVFIVNKKGEIMISPDKNDVGKRMELSDATCQACHRFGPESRNKTVIFKAASGEKVFRNVNPILNEKECFTCHNPKDKINGVLISDFSMVEIERQLSLKFKQTLIWMLFILILTMFTISFIMNRIVIDKLESFVGVTKNLARGNLNLKVGVKSNDEIGELADSFNQMVENLQRAEELRRRQELLENVIGNVKESIIICDVQGNIVSANQATQEIFGYREKVKGLAYVQLDPERNRLFGRVQKGEVVREQLAIKRADGKVMPVFVTLVPLSGEENKPLGYVEIAHDLTEELLKEQMQRQLVQSEKLAAAGQLAAGVAHEINNPLGNILLYAKLILEDMPKDALVYENLQKVVDNTLRCKEVVQNLLDYARESEVNLEPNNINELIENSLKMLENEMKLRHIEWKLTLEQGLPSVKCDRGQIRQVLVNLLQNAIQAVEDHGRLEVFSRLRPDKTGVVLGVKDSGPGIAPEFLARIFQPFFTTKVKGTGLGLSIVYGIVERHQGQILVQSNNQEPYGEGKEALGSLEDWPRGTVFYVCLPLTEGDHAYGGATGRTGDKLKGETVKISQ